MMDVVHGYELSLGIDKTVVMGDFNANPYDEELLLPSAFNAMLFKGILRARGSRTWHGKSYPFMYNPTVNWLSEDTETYGSHYYSSGDGVRGYRYLRRIGETDLIASRRPKRKISDHLPLLVDIEMR